MQDRLTVRGQLLPHLARECSQPLFAPFSTAHRVLRPIESTTRCPLAFTIRRPSMARKPSPKSKDPTTSHDAALLRRAHFLARLSRAWDARFEALARAGQIGRWYSAVGNEATTVGSALCMRPGDSVTTVH